MVAKFYIKFLIYVSFGDFGAQGFPLRILILVRFLTIFLSSVTWGGEGQFFGNLVPDREIVWAGEIEQIYKKSGVATFFLEIYNQFFKFLYF